MRILSVTSIRLLAVAAMAAPGFVACSGIDGLPDQPVPVSDSGESVGDGATTGDAASVVDAGVADAAGDAAVVADGGEVADGSVVDAVDATTSVDASADATVDAGPCVPEDDVAFCTRLGKNCGTVNANDNCGTRRTVVSCCVCSSYYESCGGGRLANVCGCTPESDWAFCTRLGRTCGPATGTDSCGLSRSVGSCGGVCPPDAGPVDAGPSDAGVADASTVQRWTFTNCGASGATGPTQAQCNTAYAGTNLAGAVTLASGIQSWQAPQSGRYRIVAMGAQGGNTGGRGALIQGDFDLSAGAGLRIAVGQRGLFSCADGGSAALSDTTPGGGGGTYVVGANNEPLVVGGGGGGHAGLFDCPCEPDGNAHRRVGNPLCMIVASGSSCGISIPPPDGECTGSGGGFVPCSVVNVSAGRSFLDGASGGRPGACNAGGFGGGGGGGVRSTPSTGDWVLEGAGGGGGYSGGAPGFQFGPWAVSRQIYPRNGVPQTAAHGSGAGSFSAGTNPIAYSGFRQGDGLVVIEKLP
jgi:hypothetical protein